MSKARNLTKILKTSNPFSSADIALYLGYTPVSPAQLNTALDNLIAGAPGALNTLDELSAALGDDSNFAATVTNALASKASTVDMTTALALKANQSTTYTKTEADARYAIQDSATGALSLPSGTTAQRPTPPNGSMLRKNTTTGYVEYYDTSLSEWVGIGAFSASGGNTVTDAGGYRYHTYTTSGTFVVSSGVKSIDYMIVAGGGSGGGHYNGNYEGGGGGAGGMIVGTMTITAGSYGIVIGAGGSSATGFGNNGGSSSTALGYTALGGGLGGPGTQNGGSGGSGGGGGWGAGAGSGTSGQGNSGGIPGGSANGGGGGGGKTAAGANGAAGGNGGAGYQWLNGTYYAGGGAGGRHGSGSSEGGGIGGNGGGGNGQPASASGTGSPGSANTGGGGGGGWNTSASAGSNGGSGIVIIRYLT